MVVAVNLLYFYSIKSEEVSRVVPLFTLDSVFTVILAVVFLHESFTLNQAFGVIVLMLGSFLLHVRFGERWRFSKAMLFMALASLLLAVEIVLVKYLLLSVSLWTYVGYLGIAVFLASLPVLVIHWSLFAGHWRERRGSLAVIFGNESLNVIAGILFTAGLALGLASLVTVLATMQYLFLLVLSSIVGLRARHLLKEHVSFFGFVLKLVSIIFMLAGVYLVVV